MYEYKVINVKVKDAEEIMNAFAKEGWRVISIINDQSSTVGSFKGLLLMTMEREKKDSFAL